MNKNEEYKPVFYENFQPVALNITRREWFAGMALNGLLSNPSINIEKSDLFNGAFDFADKMIRAGKGEN